ncbi:MAG: DUF2079 domain-containing protein [Planctomycetota bacterium]|jgi:uncharacterized membrane protein
MEAVLEAANAPFLAAAAGVLLCSAAIALVFSAAKQGRGAHGRLDSDGALAARAVLVLGAVYFAVYAYLSVHRYNRLMCGLWDLGLFESVLANALNGRFLRDYRGAFDHLDLNLAFFLPFYAVWRDGRVLLVLQSLVLALAAWPLYLLAREVSGRRSTAALVAALYLLYPLLGAGNLYDFHVVCLSPLLFFSMLLFMVRKRWRLYWLLLVLVLCTKETEAILVLGAGLYLISIKEYRRGGITAAVALAWVLIATLVVLPYVTGEGFRHFGRYAAAFVPGQRDIGAATGVRYAILLLLCAFSIIMFALVPMGFLAARRWRPLVFVFGPTVAANIFSADKHQQVFFGHYGLTVSAAAFGAAALAVGKLAKAGPENARLRLPVFFLATALLSNLAFSYPGNERYVSPAAHFEIAKSGNVLSLPLPLNADRRAFYRAHPREKFFRAAAGLFPPEAKVAAQSNLGYLLVARQQVSDLSEAVEADFYVFDLAARVVFTHPQEYLALLQRLTSEEGFTRFLDLSRAGEPSFVFFSRGAAWMDFYYNAKRAHSRDPADPFFARAVTEVERMLGIPPTIPLRETTDTGIQSLSQ